MIIPASARMTTMIVGGGAPAGGGGCVLGTETEHAFTTSIGVGNLFGYRAQASCSGTPTSISFYFAGVENSSTTMAIYADNAGSVASAVPLGYSDQVGVGSGDTWIEHTGGTLSGTTGVPKASWTLGLTNLKE